MQPEQPNTPSQDAQPSDVGSPEPSTSDEPKGGSSPGWFSRLFNRQPAQEAGPDDGGEQATPGGASRKLTLSEEELKRRVQAEADRRDYDRQQRQKAEERKRLRDEDPWAYAEQERQAEKAQEQDQGLTTFFANVGVQHDRIAIDPLMEMLPLQERQRIMKIEGAGRGLEGRKLVVTEALKSLERHWKAEGEKQAQDRLRSNSAFRKQVLSEARGGIAEPDLLPAFSGPSSADKKVADILRDFYGVRHNSAS
jgi:hypothetical protein